MNAQHWPGGYSESCERNGAPIFRVLREVLPQQGPVLEIGSGTGQHACEFAAALPGLQWQTSDVPHVLPALKANLEVHAAENVLAPVALDVAGDWPGQRFAAAFTANSLHIMSWQHVESLFAGLPAVMNDTFKLCVYGPFNYEGRFTSDSNARFEDWLKARDPLSGIRDFEAVNELAGSAGLELLHDVGMPANNRLLVWQSPEDITEDNIEGE